MGGDEQRSLAREVAVGGGPRDRSGLGRLLHGGGLSCGHEVPGGRDLAEDTGDRFFMFEDDMAHGKTTPLHLHPGGDELTYLLEGEILVQVDGVETRGSKGGMSFVPRGMPQAVIALSDTARLLTIGSPAATQAFYRGATEPATSENVDVVDMSRLKASAEEHGGIRILGPSPFDLSRVG